MICDFCGAKHLPVVKYKCTGINFGKRTKKTVRMCVLCNAHTDTEWAAHQFDWDNVTKMIPVGGRHHE